MKKNVLAQAIVAAMRETKWLCPACGHCNKACSTCAKCGKPQ